MSDLIRLLPDSIANQIAAGEVVQRSSSVVKELLENAIDAGASKIKVIIKEAGKSLIQVIDDGSGMSEMDARMSFERHATSKIQRSEDLYAIKTLGFRGEALASVAAVAQVEMKTKLQQQDLGTRIVVEGSETKIQEPISTVDGTSVSVKNLFYNVPARRNFLKSNPVEMKHIMEEFIRVSLSYHDIAFTLHQNDLEIYNLPYGKLSQRIVNIYSRSYQQQLVSCQEDTEIISIKGYIGKPEFAKKTRGEQFFFVNKRYIRSNYLNHAVTNAYEGLLPADSHPFYVLFIEIEPSHIDINVHPAKAEIKFDDERLIYGIVRAAVKQSLGTHNITPSIDFDFDVNFKTAQSARVDLKTKIAEKNYQQFRNVPLDDRNRENWEKLFAGASKESWWSSGIREEDDPSGQGVVKHPSALKFESAAHTLDSKDVDQTKHSSEYQEITAFQMHNSYIFTPIKSGVMIIDQSSAHERVLYDRFISYLENQGSTSQQLLFPFKIELNPSDFSLVMEIEDEIRALGFQFETFGKNTISINGAPSDVDANQKELFEGLLEQFKKNKSELSLDNRENLARSLAKRSCLKSGQRLDLKEMNILIDQLFACANPNYAPNGQLTFFVVDLEKIQKFFK